jgi:hypothetical protein
LGILLRCALLKVPEKLVRRVLAADAKARQSSSDIAQRAHHQSTALVPIKLDPVAVVRSYIENNIARFRDVPDPSITGLEFANSLGFLHVNDNGSLEYAVPNKSFTRGVAPLNVGDVLRALDAAGLLVRGRDKYVSKVPIRNSADDGRTFVYRIRSTIMDLNA